jgi:AcrR family transcriptional regulator
MKAKVKSDPTRRHPVQRRSRQTVEDVLDAVVKILKRDGIDGVTTNRIAEVAGLSIGSIYQYFPDKRAIFTALHDRHVEQIGGVIESTLVKHAASPFEALVRALVEALIDAHASDSELHQLMASDVPHGADGARALEVRLRGTFRLVLASRARGGAAPRDLDKMLFVLPQLDTAARVEGLRSVRTGREWREASAGRAHAFGLRARTRGRRGHALRPQGPRLRGGVGRGHRPRRFVARR